jgi:hypothetical protein
LVNYANTIRDNVRENDLVMKKLPITRQSKPCWVILAKPLMMQLLANLAKVVGFAKVVFDLLN